MTEKTQFLGFVFPQGLCFPR